VNVVSMSAGFPNDFCAFGAMEELPGKHTVRDLGSARVCCPSIGQLPRERGQGRHDTSLANHRSRLP
jgi:hypothetical protein